MEISPASRMWNRLSNIAQNVQSQLDTVVDNVNKSIAEEPESQSDDIDNSQLEQVSVKSKLYVFIATFVKIRTILKYLILKQCHPIQFSKNYGREIVFNIN